MSELTEVEDVVAAALKCGHHEFQRQVVCGGGRVDIFDGTTSEIIECKLHGDAESLAAAVDQLTRYRPYFFDPQLAIAVPRIDPSAKWLLPALAERGIRIIEVEKGVAI